MRMEGFFLWQNRLFSAQQIAKMQHQHIKKLSPFQHVSKYSANRSAHLSPSTPALTIPPA